MVDALKNLSPLLSQAVQSAILGDGICFGSSLSKGEVRASPGGTNRMEQGLRPGCWSGRHLILPPHLSFSLKTCFRQHPWSTFPHLSLYLFLGIFLQNFPLYIYIPGFLVLRHSRCFMIGAGLPVALAPSIAAAAAAAAV